MHTNLWLRAFHHWPCLEVLAHDKNKRQTNLVDFITFKFSTHWEPLSCLHPPSTPTANCLLNIPYWIFYFHDFSNSPSFALFSECLFFISDELLSLSSLRILVLHILWFIYFYFALFPDCISPESPFLFGFFFYRLCFMLETPPSVWRSSAPT